MTHWYKLRSTFFWVRLLPTNIVVGLSTLGPIGRKLKAPGTWGSFAGIILYAVFFLYMHPIVAVLLNLLLIYFAMALTDEAEDRLMMRDPGMIILDEIVAVPLVFLGLGGVGGAVYNLGVWPVLLVGFLIFRLFDIWKPGPIKKIQNLPGGIGCVMDDVAAGLASCITMHILWHTGQALGWF